MSLIIKRSAATIYTIDVDENTVLRQSLQGEDKIIANFKYGSVLSLLIGDYTEYDGRTYVINRLPEIIKTGEKQFNYSIDFEGEIYELNDVTFRNDKVSDFSYYGTAEDFIDLIVSNANRIKSGWLTGTIDFTEKSFIQFSGDTCRTALTKIAKHFNLEFSISSKSINLVVAVGEQTGLMFEYGQGKGLFSLSRKNFDSGNIVTRLYGLGSEKNIDYTYGQKRLGFSSEYLDNNTGIYGIKEGEVIFEDIFPQRTGTVTAIDSNLLKFTDSGIDFNINNVLIEGETAKVIFQTGNLAGLEFDIAQYDNTDKEILLIEFAESSGEIFPNVTDNIQAGDEYIIINITMPTNYTDTAETLLQEETQKELEKISIPRVLYDLNFDWRKLKQDQETFVPGDSVHILDVALGIDNNIRITSVEFPIVSPYKIKTNVSNYLPFARQERNIIETAENATNINLVNVTNNELARRNTHRQDQLQTLLFDPDGYSDLDVINPLRINTSIISIGVRSANFRLDSVVFDVKSGGDANKITATAGNLIHREIEIEGVGSTWAISPALSQSGLTPAQSYYLYAKCSKTALTGEWLLTTTQEEADQENYYYFWVGILYDVQDGYRDFDFVNGKTQIVGDTITTGKVKDVTGVNYFDIENGKFYLGTATKGIDWDVTTAGVLTIRGGVIADIFKTAASGQRVEIDGTDGSLHFYNSSSVETAKLESGILTAIGAVLESASFSTAESGQRIDIKSTDNDIRFYDDSGGVMIFGTDVGGTSGVNGLDIDGADIQRIWLQGTSSTLNALWADYYDGVSIIQGGIQNGIFSGRRINIGTASDTVYGSGEIYVHNTTGKLVFKDSSSVEHDLY